MRHEPGLGDSPGGPDKNDFLAKARRNEGDGKAIQAHAVALESQVDERLHDSQVWAHRQRYPSHYSQKAFSFFF